MDDTDFIDRHLASDCNSLLFSSQFPNEFGGLLALSEVSRTARKKQ
jgi:hypothetical protein